MSPTLRSHFDDYAAFHRTAGNQACHYVGIPLIVLTALAMLSRVELATLGGYTLTLAVPVLGLVTAYYIVLDVSLALLMLLVFALMAVAGRHLPFALALGLFVAGWIFQYIGHYVYEKKSPAFYRNAQHLLVGPLWIAAKAIGRA